MVDSTASSLPKTKNDVITEERKTDINKGKLFPLQIIAIHHKSNDKSNYLKCPKNSGSILRYTFCTCVARET